MAEEIGVTEEIKVFISYSWDTAEHKTWVRQLAVALHQEPGIHVVFDDFEMYAGADAAKFMERIEECDRVVAICTPTYVERVNKRTRGSGYEGALISAELVDDMGVDKFIPVLRIGEQRPKCLRTKIYVDCRDDGIFDQKLQDLLDAIIGRPPLERPQKRESNPLLTPEQKHTIRESEDLSQQRGTRRRTSLPVNLIPAELLDRLGMDQVVVLCNEDLDGRVLGTTDFDPSSLREIEGLESLSDLRRREGVYSITMSMVRLTPLVISDATNGFEHREQIAAELRTLLDREGEVYVVYAVTHFNHKPLEEMTVFIGGDCYRKSPEINNLKSVLTRTKILAQAMIRKAVIVFPDIPALHGGKKGEWLIVDRSGCKIEEISDVAIIALGTLIIPTGIKFLNRYKEQRAREKGIYDSFPAQNSIRPDTASPDILSGSNWQTMCDVWAKRGVNLSFVTCLPQHLGGPMVPAAYPTSYGVVATALKLVDHRFGRSDKRKLRFVLEALGSVGRATVEALVKEKGIAPEQITAVDRSAEACRLVSDQYGVKTLAMASRGFYESLGPDQKHDVWINNGEGDDTRPEHVQKLLDCGVRIFCGAANNFLKLTDDPNRSPDHLKRKSLRKIFAADGWAWPDEAASGGGWTLAVVDLLTRAKGEHSSSEAVKRQILETIIARNEMLVDTVIGDVSAGGKANGQAIWHRVEQIIDNRVQVTLERDIPRDEILAAAVVTGWRLT